MNVVNSCSPSTPRTFEGFVLENQSGQLVTTTSAIHENETLNFYSPTLIVPVSSGSWNAALLKQLKVKIETLITMAEFLGRFNLVNDEMF